MRANVISCRWPVMMIRHGFLGTGRVRRVPYSSLKVRAVYARNWNVMRRDAVPKRSEDYRSMAHSYREFPLYYSARLRSLFWLQLEADLHKQAQPHVNQLYLADYDV